jgi:hypothetical protein
MQCIALITCITSEQLVGDKLEGRKGRNLPKTDEKDKMTTESDPRGPSFVHVAQIVNACSLLHQMFYQLWYPQGPFVNNHHRFITAKIMKDFQNSEVKILIMSPTTKNHNTYLVPWRSLPWIFCSTCFSTDKANSFLPVNR